MDIICNLDASDHETSLWVKISMISGVHAGKSPSFSIYSNYIGTATLSCSLARHPLSTTFGLSLADARIIRPHCTYSQWNHCIHRQNTS